MFLGRIIFRRYRKIAIHRRYYTTRDADQVVQFLSTVAVPTMNPAIRVSFNGRITLCFFDILPNDYGEMDMPSIGSSTKKEE